MNSGKTFALLSVYNKEGIVDFAKVLIKSGYSIISTGGTYETLADAKIKVTPIEEITGNPRDSFDGRIKTISFQIESGILFDRKNPDHVKQAKDLGVPQIDVVVCNLYPFEQKHAVENIDVGGPTMMRAAAKNFENVLVVVDPKDYKMVSKALLDEKVDGHLRQKLAAEAFYYLSFYDSNIGRFFNVEQFPQKLTIPLKKLELLRYGENPHQQGSLYIIPNTNSPLKKLKHLWGRELSGTNIGDIFAGIETVRIFTNPAACVIKHHSPCGVAESSDASEALKRAIDADPISAFGGVVVINRPMDKKAAQVIATFKHEKAGNIDIVAVPQITKDGLNLLKKVRKSMGVYTFGNIPKTRSENLDTKFFGGVALLQTFDDNLEEVLKNWQVVTTNKPTKKQLDLMKFGFKAVKTVRSNAVLVVDKNIPMTRGIGAGQTSRVLATKIALEQAGKFVKDGILISDSFFPFPDSVEMAAKFGIGAILQQGGSINDQVSIDAANKVEIPMVFTGRRVFRH